MRFGVRGIAVSTVVGAAMLVAACGGDSTGPNSTANIGGNWNLSITASNAGLSLSCQGVGNVAISQNGANFTGNVTNSTQTCTGPGGTASSDMDGQLTGGQISGNSMTYSDGTCNYTGAISGSPANR